MFNPNKKPTIADAGVAVEDDDGEKSQKAEVVTLGSQIEPTDVEEGGAYSEVPDDEVRRYLFPNLRTMTMFGTDGVFDWRSADPNSNIAALDEFVTRSSYGIRGLVERIGVDTLDLKGLEKKKLYSSLIRLITTQDANILSVADQVIRSGAETEYLRIFNAFTELICECHDKTHVMFLKINMERAESLLTSFSPSSPIHNFTAKLVQIFKNKFQHYTQKTNGCISQDKARETIDAFSACFQTDVLGATEINTAGYLCDLYRQSKGPNIVDDATQVTDEENLPKQVTEMIKRNIKYGVPDACVLENEPLFDDITTSLSLLAAADAAGTKFPDVNKRCLFVVLQTFYSQENYDSFFGSITRPGFTRAPFTVAAGFECGGTIEPREYEVMPHPMHETNAGGFCYAYCTLVNWEKIKYESINRSKVSKDLLAPVIFVYCACNNFTKDPKRIEQLKVVATKFKGRAIQEIVNTKRDFLLKNGCTMDMMTVPDPLAYYKDEKGRDMILCIVWNTHGSKLSNNGTLTLSAYDPRVTESVRKSCIRGDQTNESCEDLLNEVIMLMITIDDIDASVNHTDKSELLQCMKNILAKCGIDLKEMMDRSKFLTALLIKLLTKLDALIFTVDVSLAKSICHSVLTIVRHADVLSVYGKLNVTLNRDEMTKSIKLMCNLIQKGESLLRNDSTNKSRSVDEESFDEESCLTRLHSEIKKNVDIFHKNLVRGYLDNGLKHFMSNSIRRPELRLYDLLYFMATYKKLNNKDGLFCGVNEFVRAFTPVSQKDIMPKCVLLKKFLSIDPRQLETFHVLTDMRSHDWSDKLLLETTSVKYDPNSTLLRKINEVKLTREINEQDIKDIIRDLKLGEVCVELNNFNYGWPAARGMNEWSLSLTSSSTSRAGVANLINKSRLNDLFLVGFEQHVTAFIETNCSQLEGFLMEDYKTIIRKVFREANIFSNIPVKIQNAFVQFLQQEPMTLLVLDKKYTLSERGGDSDDELGSENKNFVGTPEYVSIIRTRRQYQLETYHNEQPFGSIKLGTPVASSQQRRIRPTTTGSNTKGINTTVSKEPSTFQVLTGTKKPQLPWKAKGIRGANAAPTDDKLRADAALQRMKYKKNPKGGSRKKNKQNITKKYRTKTSKSSQTRRNKHKYKHAHTIKRRKSRRNNSN